ncbi:MAG: gamma-glutamyl-phosphate reductase, partial [Kiritimatiellaeota bacterium]|nr:gamma-glutamyl-phosphate reductase [Kiritimatiellota bacterium]
MNLHEQMLAMGDTAVEASRKLLLLGPRRKHAILLAMADEIEAHKAVILAANEVDVAAARKDGLSAALIDRLTLNEARLAGMARGLATVANLKDPIGQRISRR